MDIYENFGVSAIQTEEGLLVKKDKGNVDSFSYDFTNCPDLAQTVAVTCAALQIPSVRVRNEPKYTRFNPICKHLYNG